MKLKRALFAVPLVALTLTLSGCGREVPDNEELKTLTQGFFRGYLNFINKHEGYPLLRANVNSLHKKSCADISEKDNEEKYKCVVEVSFTIHDPITGVSKDYKRDGLTIYSKRLSDGFLFKESVKNVLPIKLDAFKPDSNDG